MKYKIIGKRIDYGESRIRNDSTITLLTPELEEFYLGGSLRISRKMKLVKWTGSLKVASIINGNLWEILEITFESRLIESQFYKYIRDCIIDAITFNSYELLDRMGIRLIDFLRMTMTRIVLNTTDHTGITLLILEN